VIELAESQGWLVYHVANVKGQLRCKSSVGFPDLLLLKDKIVIWECKIPPNKLSPAQKVWTDRFAEVGVETKVITPEDWDYIKLTLGGSCPKNGGRMNAIIESVISAMELLKQELKERRK